MNIKKVISNSVYVTRTCPQCIKEFYPGDCDIVSTTTIDPATNTNKVLKKAPKSGWQQQRSRMNPEPIQRDLVFELACRKCPHCGYLLPPNIELVDCLNIAIVGDIFSGKSHFIAAIIHQLRRGELTRADRFTSFECLTQEEEDIYTRDVIRPLFEGKRPPLATQPKQIGEENRRPLIYELIMSPSPQHPARRVNLILYDASGEDLAVKQRMVTFSKYVLNANAIIFLADPVSMPEIYKVLPDFLQNRVVTGRTSSSVLSSISTLIGNFHGSDAQAWRKSTPIAITLTKSDLLKQLTTVRKPFSFHKRPVYNGTINLQEMDIIDREVRQLLEGYNERMLLQIALQFPKVKFFATSATGYAPNKDGTYPDVDPCRCLDPILWILYQLNIFHVPL